MKLKFISIFLSLLFIVGVLSLFTSNTNANNNVSNNEPVALSTVGLTYSIDEGGLTATCSGIGSATDTEIVIASTYEGLPITSIGASAFQNCTTITSVNIPNSVLTIGPGAFDSCTNLISVILSSNLTSMRQGTFIFCTSLTSIVLPSSLTTLFGTNFNNCVDLTSVIFEGQAPSIYRNMFFECSSILIYNFSYCTSVPVLENISCLGHASGCEIIVPDALYDEWIGSANWSTLTNVVWVKASENVA